MSDKTVGAGSPGLPSGKASKATQTNVARLRGHLTPNSLALALLDAWDKGGDTQDRRARLLSTLQTYSVDEDAGNAAAPSA
jgi:hypothetical protein